MKKRLIRIMAVLLAAVSLPVALRAQYHFELVSVAPPDGGRELRFGRPVNITLRYRLDSPYTNEQALACLKNYFLIMEGIPRPELKIGSMSVISNPVGVPDTTAQRSRAGSITWQASLPEAFKDTSGKKELSAFWKQHYRPLHHQRSIKIGLLSTRPEDQAVPAVPAYLRFYATSRVWLFVFLFGALLALVLFRAAKDHFTLLRDDTGECTAENGLLPFSLSRVQVFFWTFCIFGMIAYVWAVTDRFPELTSAHLVLLGISAGQRILAQIIDGRVPAKNTAGTANLTRRALLSGNVAAVGCSVDFFTDIISDKSGLSISRLQFVVATLIFLVMFITEAFQKLQIMDFSVEQLALMGTSAGLYLWNKQLDQRNNPPANPPAGQ